MADKTPPAAETKPVAETQKVARASVARLQDSGYIAQNLILQAEVGTTVEDIQRPEYWADVAARLQPCDLITVIMDDFSWEAELRVLSATRFTARVLLKSHVVYGAAASVEETDAPYQVSWQGPHHKYAIVRKLDGKVIKNGIPKLEDAQREMLDYVKSL